MIASAWSLISVAVLVAGVVGAIFVVVSVVEVSRNTERMANTLQELLYLQRETKAILERDVNGRPK